MLWVRLSRSRFGWSCFGRDRGCDWRCLSRSVGVVRERCDVCLVFNEDGNNLSKFNVFGAFRVHDLCNVALVLHFVVYGGFVSLNAAENIARLNFVAYFFVPGLDVPLKYNVDLTFSIVGDKLGISSFT